MNCSMPGLPVHQQLPEFTQTHVHRVDDAIQPSHPLSSPSPPALNLSQHQGLFQWVSSSHHMAKVLEFQLHHQSFQWRTKEAWPGTNTPVFKSGWHSQFHSWNNRVRWCFHLGEKSLKDIFPPNYSKRKHPQKEPHCRKKNSPHWWKKNNRMRCQWLCSYKWANPHQGALQKIQQGIIKTGKLENPERPGSKQSYQSPKTLINKQTKKQCSRLQMQ